MFGTKARIRQENIVPLKALFQYQDSGVLWATSMAACLGNGFGLLFWIASCLVLILFLLSSLFHCALIFHHGSNPWTFSSVACGGSSHWLAGHFKAPNGSFYRMPTVKLFLGQCVFG